MFTFLEGRKLEWRQLQGGWFLNFLHPYYSSRTGTSSFPDSFGSPKVATAATRNKASKEASEVSRWENPPRSLPVEAYMS